MKKLILIPLTFLLASCAQITVPLGEAGKYGSLTVGYILPNNLPYGINIPPTLNDK